MRASDDPSWALYPNTILAFNSSDHFEIDLREAVASQRREYLHAANLDQPFAVITACNPRGRHHSDPDNARFAHQLEAQVRQRGLHLVHVDGVSPDRTHRESGVAVKVSREDAMTLAKQYHQSAFFWFDGEAFWVVPALVEAAAVRLPIVSSQTSS